MLISNQIKFSLRLLFCLFQNNFKSINQNKVTICSHQLLFGDSWHQFYNWLERTSEQDILHNSTFQQCLLLLILNFVFVSQLHMYSFHFFALFLVNMNTLLGFTLDVADSLDHGLIQESLCLFFGWFSRSFLFFLCFWLILWFVFGSLFLLSFF